MTGINGWRRWVDFFWGFGNQIIFIWLKPEKLFLFVSPAKSGGN
jgi:hypothetical protein